MIIIALMIENLNRRIISFNWLEIFDANVVCVGIGSVIIDCFLNWLVVIFINALDVFDKSCPFNKLKGSLFVEKVSSLHP